MQGLRCIRQSKLNQSVGKLKLKLVEQLGRWLALGSQCASGRLQHGNRFIRPSLPKQQQSQPMHRRSIAWMRWLERIDLSIEGLCLRVVAQLLGHAACFEKLPSLLEQ